MSNELIGKYWVLLRHQRHDYTDEQPEQDIRTMDREEACKYKYRGNWFSVVSSNLELMKYFIKIDDKELSDKIDTAINYRPSSLTGKQICKDEVDMMNAVLDETILCLESIVG
ncbi:MAG: hypothetical protein KJ906_01360 [Nanoarchaeota archaeon]|nr:hypothetical protein [Nanoarchaeota archaeon]